MARSASRIGSRSTRDAASWRAWRSHFVELHRTRGTTRLSSPKFLLREYESAEVSPHQIGREQCLNWVGHLSPSGRDDG